MANPTPPKLQSALSLQTQANNFIAVQSAFLSVSNSSSNIVFTCPIGTLRTTAKITNSGNNGCYLASGTNSTTVAIVSSSSPQPTTGTNIVSNCDYVAAGAILTQDYLQGTLAFAAVCTGSNTTTLEISTGFGQ